jgi:hypothetical protein
MYERASGRRQLKMGEGMVTAVRPVTVTYRDGSVERLIPGCTNFDPAHELVRERPELFTLCHKNDRTTAPRRFWDALRTAERRLEQAGPASRTSHSRPGRYQLRSPRKESRRLP